MSNFQVDSIVFLLKKTRIFSCADDETLRRAVLSGEVRSYARSESIYNESNYSRALGLIVSGEAQVTKGKIVMSRLLKGELFGAVTLYNECDYFVTEITAASKCKVFFMNRGIVSEMMGKNIEIAESYIAYLSERIYFLNGRINAFTAGSACDKLREYLLENAAESEGVKAFTPASLMELAKKLDLSRASLYRAIDELCKNGEIEKRGKTFLIMEE